MKIVFVICIVAFLSACQSTPPRSLTDSVLLSKQQDFLRAYQADLQAITQKTEMRIKREYEQARRSNESKPQSYDILILSGGGAFGAFGAGFLKGWGEVTHRNFRCPDFDYVSGISTGSLIAPFAFLGTEEAYRDIIKLYENPESDWVVKKGLIPYLPSNDSVYDISKLREKIKQAISPSMMNSLAKEGKKGRQVLIGATNLDYGLLRVWDLSKVVDEVPSEQAVEDTVSILSASSSIPGLFAPVEIDEMLYADGGASMQIVSGMDRREWAYQKKGRVSFVNPRHPIKIRVWIIINQKLLTDPKVVPPRWVSVAERSLKTLLRASTLQSIQDIETFVRLINLRPDFDAQFHYVAIPQDFPIVDSDTMFDAKTMRDLTKLGLEMGSRPESWKSEALRPGAPFELE